MTRLAALTRLLACMGMMALALSGCAFKTLKAPCSPDEGQPLAYAPLTHPTLPLAAIGETDGCGPLRPI